MSNPLDLDITLKKNPSIRHQQGKIIKNHLDLDLIIWIKARIVNQPDKIDMKLARTRKDQQTLIGVKSSIE